MSFVGKLEAIGAADLLQVLAGSGKTGRLSLTRRDGQGVIVFRRGKIIYAASSAGRETLGNLLLSRRLIGEEELVRALELQHQAGEEKRLGTILVEMGALSQEDLREVLKGQVGSVLAEFLGWDGGFFKFEPLEIPDHGEVAVDAEDFLLAEGLRTDQVLLELEGAEEEAGKEAAPGRGPAPPQEEEAAEQLAAGDLAAPVLAEGVATLSSLINEVQGPEITAELVRSILAEGARIVSRGILFRVRHDGFYSTAQFGLLSAEGEAQDSPQAVKIPLEGPSVLREVLERRETYRGPLRATGPHALLIEQLGGGIPGEVLAIPMIVGGRGVLIFYGDNHPGGQPIGPSGDLEMRIREAGVAIEQAIVTRKSQHLQRLREGGGD